MRLHKLTKDVNFSAYDIQWLIEASGNYIIGKVQLKNPKDD